MTQIGAKLGVLLMASTLLSGCVDGRQGNYYTSYVDPMVADNVVPLAEGEHPQLIFNEDIEGDKEKYQTRGFIIIGESQFQTTDEVRFLKRKIDSHANHAIAHAMKVRATHVLYQRKKISEYNETTVKDGEYETEFFERFQNVSVYMVREMEL